VTDLEVFVQQLITGLSNGSIIAIVALGYTMVYGIVELINFAHGDLFMLGCFLALTLLGVCTYFSVSAPFAMAALFLAVPLFCGVLNVLVERFAYRPLRNAPRLAPLVSAIGVSFIFVNIGLLWGGLPMEVFSYGVAPAAPKDFPILLPSENLLGDSPLFLSWRELLVFVATIPLLCFLWLFVTKTKLGCAMRAVAQNPVAAALMGVKVDKVISVTFFIGGVLAGAASIIYAMYNSTIYFQMGYRVGIDAFAAAVLGGIGSLVGACCGGLLIGVVRSLSDQYGSAEWTNVVVFTIFILFLLFRPAGIFGIALREKV
jgi:branched-chain amino acid transport system permease protein